jgi:DNA-directed RNA polymerase
VKVGAILIKLFVESATDFQGNLGFSHRLEQVGPNARKGVILAQPSLLADMVNWDVDSVHPKFLPMLVPPVPWDRHNRGGFLKIQSKVFSCD